MKFNKKDYHDAINQIQQEWRHFDVPKVIHDRIIQLAWDSVEEDVVIKTIMDEFQTKKCYATKCYWFSDAFKFEREQYAKMGLFLACDSCKESCIPEILK